MSGTCERCSNCEIHGYPPVDVPEWYCFTVYLVCSKRHDTTNPWDTCKGWEEGEPKIVRDDKDW